MEKKGHEVHIVARDKEVTKYLLNKYEFKYDIISKKIENPLGVGIEAGIRILNLLKKSKFRPEITVSITDGTIGAFSRILGVPPIQFTDTEHADIILKTSIPFADVILTPTCFKRDLGKKQIRYNGYHELAYLHPNYFKPDSSVLDDLEVDKGDTFILLRFISWTASHDIGQTGVKNRIKFVKELEKYGRVFISAEGKLEKELEKYKIKIPPDKIHDVLYYATLYVGEGATMATESAILGTPAIYISSLVGTMGNLIELEKRYELVFSYATEVEALQRAIEILENYNPRIWRERRKRLIQEKIDVTKFMIWFVENYPESFKEFKENPELHYSFR